MKCALCPFGETRPGTATVTLDRGETTVIIKGVPAEVCEDCGDYYLDETVTGVVLRRAEQAVRSGAEVEITRYVA